MLMRRFLLAKIPSLPRGPAAVVSAAFLLLLCTGLAAASPISFDVISDTPTSLLINWAWDDENQPAVPDYQVYDGDYWSATLGIAPIVTRPNFKAWAVTWGFQHVSGPHSEDQDPAPAFFSFGIALDLGTNEWIGLMNTSGKWEHPLDPSGSHFDLYQFLFSRNPFGADFAQTVANHVPVPTAALLLCSGVLGLIMIRRRQGA
jgi:hypothetical protein